MLSRRPPAFEQRFGLESNPVTLVPFVDSFDLEFG
jgi:hypothetical protein